MDDKDTPNEMKDCQGSHLHVQKCGKDSNLNY